MHNDTDDDQLVHVTSTAKAHKSQNSKKSVRQRRALPSQAPAMHSAQSVSNLAMQRARSTSSPVVAGYLCKCGPIVKSWKLETCKGSADLSPGNVLAVDRIDDDDAKAVDTDGNEVPGFLFVISCRNRLRSVHSGSTSK